jgi:hypothetical protein
VDDKDPKIILKNLFKQEGKVKKTFPKFTREYKRKNKNHKTQ